MSVIQTALQCNPIHQVLDTATAVDQNTVIEILSGYKTLHYVLKHYREETLTP